MYGAFGGVVLAPFSVGAARACSAPRTATGASAPSSTSITSSSSTRSARTPVNVCSTNLSAGINYKPDTAPARDPRVQPGRYRHPERPGRRVPRHDQVTNQTRSTTRRSSRGSRRTRARGSISAGLGELERFEVTVAGGISLRVPASRSTPFVNPTARRRRRSICPRRRATKSTARSSIVTRSATRGSASMPWRRSRRERSRSSATKVLAFRAFVSRELQSGKGEWEAEIAYSTTKDTTTRGYACMHNDAAGPATARATAP